VLVFRDETEKRQLVQRLSHQAVEDALTGLENRRGLERYIKQRLDSPVLREPCALLYLDLDQFKIVNDIGGHAAGDTLLKQVGTLIQPHLRPGDRLARLGGDEFGILLERCLREPAVQVAQSVREAIRNHHFEWEGKLFTVGASIGVVPVPESGATLSSLLIAADDACYAAKERGGNRVCVYELNDSTMLQRHGQMEWVGRINEALRHNHFCLYYQPIIALSHEMPQREWGEILLRLLDDDFRVILPQNFTPAAERYGLMPAVDRWVLRNSLAMLQSRDSPNLMFSINLSGHSLSDEDFLNFVIAEFRRTRVNPSQVCFEITETAAISNLSYAMRFFSILREVGCFFALDDFGTGLSSFEYLRNLPIDYLKIAGRFVKNMAKDKIDYAMVEGIHHIAQVMGLKTIAEHVEDEAILAGLKTVGVEYAQGNMLGLPRPLNTKAAKMK
jgi:diguanylate cyclase (GGDEF)-like protein